MGLRMEESKRKPMGTLKKRNKALGLCRGSIGGADAGVGIGIGWRGGFLHLKIRINFKCLSSLDWN